MNKNKKSSIVEENVSHYFLTKLFNGAHLKLFGQFNSRLYLEFCESFVANLQWLRLVSIDFFPNI